MDRLLELDRKYYKQGYVSLSVYEKVLLTDIARSVIEINKFIKKTKKKGKNPHIILTQGKFDALVIRCLSGFLNKKMSIKKNRNRKNGEKH